MTISQAAPEQRQKRPKRRAKTKLIKSDPLAKRIYAPEEEWDIQWPTNLPDEDGEPLESNWHRAEISLLIDVTQQHRQGRKDYYAGGNMFIYYSTEQIRSKDYRGPDFFVVLNVDGSQDRKFWVIWEENGRYPNVIVELLSPRTRRADETTKKQLYAETFRTPEYFYYDPDELVLHGFRLTGEEYTDLLPNEEGWLWSNELNLWLGTWEGEFQGHRHVWLRFYTPEAELVPTKEEAEHQRAEQERQRADTAEETLTRWRERLQAMGIDPESLTASEQAENDES